MTMSMREIFNKVEKHLLKQNEQSIDATTLLFGNGEGENCRYRTDSGLSCAVGCLMTDDMYDSSLEGDSVTDVAVVEALTPIIGVSPRHQAKKIDLLNRLQIIHDDGQVDTWAYKLSALKLAFNIS